MHQIIDRLRAARSDQRGFTLIELLIVIIILGVLAAVVVFSVRGVTNNSDDAACRTELRTVETAVEAYYAEEGEYPTTFAQLTAADTKYLREAPSDEWNTALGADGAVTSDCD